MRREDVEWVADEFWNRRCFEAVEVPGKDRVAHDALLHAQRQLKLLPFRHNRNCRLRRRRRRRRRGHIPLLRP
jgi:hypothetical protein